MDLVSIQLHSEIRLFILTMTNPHRFQWFTCLPCCKLMFVAGNSASGATEGSKPSFIEPCLLQNKFLILLNFWFFLLELFTGSTDAIAKVLLEVSKQCHNL